MKTITLKLTGQSPILMHSDRFADPLDPATKQHKILTSKKSKTDDDHRDIAKSEWKSSMYYDEEMGPYMPGQNIKTSLVQAAKLHRRGADFKRALLVLEDKVRLEYPGSRDPEVMWNDWNFIDRRGVKVTGKKLIRYRPKFNNWSLEVTAYFSPEMIDPEHVYQAAEEAGIFIGLGDYRPETAGAFGRFDAEVIENG